VIVEEDRLEGLAHVPFEMVSEHAQEDVSAHAVAVAVVDRADLEVDGLVAAEGALDGCELLVGLDDVGGLEGRGLEGRGREAGAQHVDAVERRLGGDRGAVALEGEVGVREPEPALELVDLALQRRRIAGVARANGCIRSFV
jgi:hypothetical protein